MTTSSFLKTCLLAAVLTMVFQTRTTAQLNNNLEMPTSINEEGTAPDTSAILDLKSDSLGLLVPRMATAQRTAIATPATGLTVFDTDESNFYYHDGSQWQRHGLPTDGQLEEVLKSDATGQASWQPLIDPTLLPNPAPALTGSLAIGSSPRSVAVQGSFAYVVDTGSDDLKVIDVSDPANPTQSGSLGLGVQPRSVAVQGSYAYVVDGFSDDLKIIDVSDPASPTLSGSLAIGGLPLSVAVQGSFTYVVDGLSGDLKVIQLSGTAAVGMDLNGELAAYTEADPEVGANATNYLPKWDGSALVKSTPVFEDGSGHVGIGTASPNTLLSITPGSLGAKLTVWDGGSMTNHYGLGVSSLQQNYHVIGTVSSHVFYVDGKNGDGTELMRIQGDGKVGIGTPSPDALLDIEGGALLAQGTTGGTPVTGAGTRLMWIPAESGIQGRRSRWDGMERCKY